MTEKHWMIGLHDALAGGLEEWAKVVLAEAALNAPRTDPEHDPDPSETLALSGRVEESNERSVYHVVFDTPYASRMENEELHHPQGGSAHYLEHALQNSVLVGNEIMVRAYRHWLESKERPGR